MDLSRAVSASVLCTRPASITLTVGIKRLEWCPCLVFKPDACILDRCYELRVSKSLETIRITLVSLKIIELHIAILRSSIVRTTKTMDLPSNTVRSVSNAGHGLCYEYTGW